jgi:hypothetical protein
VLLVELVWCVILVLLCGMGGWYGGSDPGIGRRARSHALFSLLPPPLPCGRHQPKPTPDPFLLPTHAPGHLGLFNTSSMRTIIRVARPPAKALRLLLPLPLLPLPLPPLPLLLPGLRARGSRGCTKARARGAEQQRAAMVAAAPWRLKRRLRIRLLLLCWCHAW